MERKQATNIEVKKNNRNRIFRYICKYDTVSNPDISYELKMSLPTVTRITKELIEKGFVEEKGELKSTGGRRAKALSAVADIKLAVGLDITKHHISLVLTNIMGDVLNHKRIYQPYEPEEAYYRKVNEKLESFLDESEADRDKILGIGISFPGILDQERQIITYSHILGVEDIPFDSVSCFFNYPCIFTNDANAGAYAEGFRAEGTERFFYLSLSNSVGGAIFSNNKLVRGKNFRCGEAGHMTIVPDGKECYCGKKGCLDAYCAAGYLSDMTNGKLDQFFMALDQGDAAVRRMWDDYTACLAVAVNNIHMLLDCDVILGGYVGCYVEPYIQDIWDKVSERNIYVETEPYVKAGSYKIEVAALGVALQLIENFVSQI